MSLGSILQKHDLVTHEQVREAHKRQQLVGGSWLESALALELVTRADVDAILRQAPPVPRTIGDTGLDDQFLLDLLLKSMYASGLDTRVDVGESMRLPQGIVEQLLERAKGKRLVESRGTSEVHPSILRYGLTGEGIQWASDGLQRCQYVGPAPVPISEYRLRVIRQSIAHERVNGEALAAHCGHMLLEPGTLERLGPAINSAKAILFYGVGGNGKTSLAESIGAAFRDAIYVPHSIEIDRQVVKIYDPATHRPPLVDDAAAERFDPRWVRCRRPVVLTGGELTMELLDLSFDPVAKYYEAPAHVKASGGVFIIDDFGRQRVRPSELVNRWLLPLERGIDFLTLHTGKKVELDFDEIVIFSTNFPPEELMDPPSLRRIGYKIQIGPPSPERYTQIMRRVCDARGLTLDDTVLAELLNPSERRIPLACYQPKEIVEHVIASCKFEDVPPALTLARVRDALRDLALDETQLGS